MTGLSVATLLLAAFVIPGALYVWSFERPAGRYGIGLKDRALRLLGTSAVLLSLFAWALYWAYIEHQPTFANLKQPPWWFWIFPILYTGVPAAIGGLLGYGWKQNWSWVRFLFGRNRAPSAWDHLFQDRPAGGIRCKLKSGTWLAGIYAEVNGDRPYASGHPGPQDVYLPRTIHINRSTGGIILNEQGNPIVLGASVLLRWEEIEFLEFIRPEDTSGQ